MLQKQNQEEKEFAAFDANRSVTIYWVHVSCTFRSATTSSANPVSHLTPTPPSTSANTIKDTKVRHFMHTFIKRSFFFLLKLQLFAFVRYKSFVKIHNLGIKLSVRIINFFTWRFQEKKMHAIGIKIGNLVLLSIPWSTKEELDRGCFYFPVSVRAPAPAPYP